MDMFTACGHINKLNKISDFYDFRTGHVPLTNRELHKLSQCISGSLYDQLTQTQYVAPMLG